MTYFVYVLLSQKDKNLYIGCTTNLEKRLKRHNTGQVMATKNRRPLVRIHKEIFVNKADAFNRERFLKSLWAGRFKDKIKKEYLNKISHSINKNG
ncbi:MAG: GIY-YIG nuclease family protein [Candidatus Liptonbacteria bacterium]|nr:GIY-YIG nuclease family protein [Candidatus Liptonbacteria bacterium]